MSKEDLILKEIAWCQIHRGGSDKGDDWENGFIEGLYQALRLLRSIPKESSFASCTCPRVKDEIYHVAGCLCK